MKSVKHNILSLFFLAFCLLVVLLRVVSEFSSSLLTYVVLYAAFIILFIILIVLVVCFIIFVIRKEGNKDTRYIVLIIAAILLLILVLILPYKTIYVKIDQLLYAKNRIEVIQKIEDGTIDIQGNGKVLLRDENRKEIGATDVYVYSTENNKVGFDFITNTGLLDSSSGFLYIMYSDKHEHNREIDDYSIIYILNEEWQYISTK